MSLWLSNTRLMTPSLPVWLEEICQKLVDNNDKSFTTLELTQPRMVLDDLGAREFADALGQNSTVTAVILSCFSLVDDGAFAVGSALETSKSIQKLQFRDLRSSREVITLFRSLLGNTSVHELSLRHCQICPKGAEVMARYLQARPHLVELRFVDCQFSGNSLSLICQGIETNRTLQRLYFVNTEIGPEGAVHISDMLKSACLRELYLSENDLCDEGVAAICQGLLVNTSLRLLDLRANGITSTGAMSVQGLVARSQFLLALSLASNDLGNLGSAAIARGLANPHSVLKTLDISENGIEAVGTSAFAAMLRTNRSLQDLNMSFNVVGERAATLIASALQRNTTLQRLNLRRCGMTNHCAAAFAKKMPHMNGLRELIINKNNIDSIGSSALLEALRSNVEIEYLQVEERLNEPVAREIVHCLRLNRAGRRIFRKSNVPCPLWPHVYGRISFDSDVLYHFVKETPEVFRKKLATSDSDVLTLTADD